ncbi:MAG: oxidoreductase molybdopterin binding protein [Gemmatimonadetes bacterium]|nr:oxidoreductase molybdopterin binding protein [Gemmatimonadota bacterium]
MTLDRRRFLTLSAASVSAAMLAACGGDAARLHPLLDLATRKNETLERKLFRSGSRNRPPVDAGVAGESFPSYFVSKHMPVWDPAVRGAWRLEVSGAVRKPLSLSLDDLVRLPRISQKVDHYCVEGWNARAQFSGVRVSDLARLAGATEDAQYVDFQSFDDDYHESWDMASAMHPQTIVVIAKDGHFLNASYGAPARVHSPVKLGYKNTKYLTKVVFMPKRNGGYWSDLGYEWYGGT